MTRFTSCVCRHAVALLMLAFSFVPAQAQNREKPTLGETPADAQELTASEILSQLHIRNRIQIYIGGLALEEAQARIEDARLVKIVNARDLMMKEYAARLIEDYRNADEEVLELADDLDVRLQPAPIPESEHRKMQQLRQTRGSHFDEKFLEFAIESHRHAILALQWAASRVDVSGVRELVLDVLPALEEHLRMAKALAPADGSPEWR